MMKRKRYVIIIAVLAAIFSVSTFFLIRNHIDSKKQAEIYDELIETVEDTDETQETMSYSEDQSFLPDYQELFLQNNDMVGWIKVEDTKINYPVMQSKEEPNFYLRHGFDKAYTVYGCPYVQENCDVDGSIGQSYYLWAPYERSVYVCRTDEVSEQVLLGES